MNRRSHEECSICFYPMKYDASVHRWALLFYGIKKVNCGHIFHSKCIKTWTSSYKNNCPICRLKLK